MTTAAAPQPRELLLNAFGRSALATLISGQEARDIDATCGYPEGVTTNDYFEMIDRFGIAKRANSVLPDESWRVPPLVYETEDESEKTPFEVAWDALFQVPGLSPWHYLHRGDVESGKGHFGVVLLGLSDGRPLDEPVVPRAGMKLTFMRVFSQRSARIVKLNEDATSPDFGRPVEYSLTFFDPSISYGPMAHDTGAGGPGGQYPTTVHASRIIHLADQRESSEVYGVPRLRDVYNYLLDLKKVAGGGAEMFWQGAAPGYAIETNPNVIDPALDKESLKAEFDGFRNGLQRMMALEGMTIKSLAPQVADPTPHGMFLIGLICASVGIPLRTFMGSASGQLSADNDTVDFNNRLTRRQTNYLTPMVVLPFAWRLVDLGVLPRPEKVVVDWQDLNNMSEKDKAAISMHRVQALLQYVTSGAEKVMPLTDFLTKIMYFSPDEAAAILKSVRNNADSFTKEVWDDPVQQAQGGSGGAAGTAAKTGISGKRNAQG